MDYLMLIKWIKILCLMTVFCVRSLIFGARIVLGSTLREEFKIVKSYSYVTNSTLALYTCLFMVWGATYCHIPCLLRHTAHAEKKISKATRLAIMRISNFSNLIRELTRSPYVPFTTQDSTLFLTACFDMLWGYTRIATLLTSHLTICILQDLAIFAIVAMLIIMWITSIAMNNCECLALTVFVLQYYLGILLTGIISVCTIDRSTLIPPCIEEEIFIFGNPAFGGRGEGIC